MIRQSEKVLECCARIAACTEEQGRITRTFLSAPMRDVHRILREWMESLGMMVWVDAAGNLRGLFGSAKRRLMVASHLDTVPNAGAYDGVLGVVTGIALAEALGAPPDGLAIETIGFSEEEGVLFGIPFIGSRALCGTLDEGILAAGVRNSIRAYGLDPDQLPLAKFAPETIGYLEFHVEQGPVLESLGLPLGVVERIAGQSRLHLTFSGRANHAGTTPMHLRADALTGAAQWIGEAESLARATAGLVATTGAVHAEPNATNVIPGTVRVSLDVRHACDETRGSAVKKLLARAHEIAATRGLRVESEQRLDQPAVPMNAHLTAALADSIAETDCPVHRMTSGAGHDAMIVAPHIPATMLFLRSPGGVSHHPDESVIAEDIDKAIEAGLRFVRRV